MGRSGMAIEMRRRKIAFNLASAGTTHAARRAPDSLPNSHTRAMANKGTLLGFVLVNEPRPDDSRRAESTECRPSGLRIHTLKFILCAMSSIRRTISLPPSVAERLDKEARRRKKSFSALITELVQQQPQPLPYAGLIDDDEDLSERVEEVLARLDR